MKNTIWGLLLALLSISLVVAQSDNCEALLDDALSALEDNCDATGRNQACYGFDQVEASFLLDVDDAFFTQPADTSAVADLETIRTVPLDLENNVWGVAIMNIQADLPNTLPGQNATFILMGDVEVENAVNPDDAFQGSDGIDVTVNVPAGANVRSGASTNFNVVGGVQNGQSLIADGLSSDGEWLRVLYRDRPAWISYSVIDNTNPAIADLPVLTDELQTPMQAFYLRTGIGQPECEDAPENILLVQGPEDIEISFTVNGADVTVGSTLGLRTLIGEDGLHFLEAIAFAGEINFMGQILYPGQRSRACLGNADSRGLDGQDNDLIITCDASDPEFADDFEDWCTLENLPASIMNYRLINICNFFASQQQTGANGAGLASTNCDGFTVPSQQVIATDFAFDWTDVSGATGYVVAVHDETGTEVQAFPTIASILYTNGGTWPGSGFVDVRVYTNGEYQCFARLNFTRTADPNQGLSGDGFVARRGACTQIGFVPIWQATVSWQNAVDTPVTIEWNDFNITQSANQNQTSGSFTITSQPSANGFNWIKVSAGGETINVLGC